MLLTYKTIKMRLHCKPFLFSIAQIQIRTIKILAGRAECKRSRPEVLMILKKILCKKISMHVFIILVHYVTSITYRTLRTTFYWPKYNIPYCIFITVPVTL